VGSFRNRLPRNAGRALLRADGIAPWRYDLFHSLNQRLDSKFKRAVATFHDLFVMTEEYSTPEFRDRFAKQARNAADRADLIIAVSQFTADQVVGLLKVDRARVRVIHHGVHRAAGPLPPDDARQNIILHTGAIQKRKNITRLVEAFEQSASGWRLVLAGAAGYGAQEILSRIELSPRRPDIEVLGYVSQGGLERLYRKARIFAFPSLDEGFGIPVLEAMAHGVPVLTSNRPALVEVAGNSAVFVDPSSTVAIAHGLDELASRADFRERLRVQGFERAASWTWSRAVEQTWQVYCELL
jgi:glycosyltransferase involved in cell wall biosynthesis